MCQTGIVIRWRSTAQRERQAYHHEQAAARLIEAPPGPSKPRADAMSHARDEDLGRYFDQCERPGHNEELDEEAARRVDELRKKCGEEQHAFRIGDSGERTLPEQRPARR